MSARRHCTDTPIHTLICKTPLSQHPKMRVTLGHRKGETLLGRSEDNDNEVKKGSYEHISVWRSHSFVVWLSLAQSGTCLNRLV